MVEKFRSFLMGEKRKDQLSVGSRLSTIDFCLISIRRRAVQVEGIRVDRLVFRDKRNSIF